MPFPPWTAPIVERLRQLVPLGLSQREIAITLNGEFGTFFTRNAVAGQIDRLELRGGERRTLLRAPRVKDRRNGLGMRLIKAAREGRAIAQAEVLLESKPCSLIELTNKTCRWPLGDPLKPGFMFCGSSTADLEENRSYCPHHMSMAYNYDRR